MRGARGIGLVVGNDVLRGTLARTLARLTGRSVSAATGFGDAAPEAIVVTTTSDCSTAECSWLAQSGKDVIVLSAVPSPFQGKAYLSAGAVGYLPMLVDTGPLLAILATLT